MHEQIDSLQLHRASITKSISSILSDLFGDQVDIFMYGSLATGLALETSDMDLAIHGLSIKERSDIFNYMN